jgi:hypothetical protein
MTLSLKDGCSARARAVVRPKTPEPTMTIDFGKDHSLVGNSVDVISEVADWFETLEVVKT